MLDIGIVRKIYTNATPVMLCSILGDATMYEDWRDWLKTEDIAKRLQLKKETIAKWCREGKIKAVKMPLCWLIKREDFDAFIKERSR
jgi:excisionase family DNA binding protein